MGGGLLTLGETMGLLTATRIGPLRHASALRLGVGGAESNVAIGLARLGHDAVWAGRVGDDEIGRLVLATLRAEGVDVSLATIDSERPTGLMLKARRSADRVEVAYHRAGSAASRLRPEHLDLSAVADAGAVHVTGITPALGPHTLATVLGVVDAAREHRVPVSVAVNHREALWGEEEAAPVLRGLAARADVVLASEGEAAMLVGPADDSGALADRLAEQAGADAVVTGGERGAWAVCGGRRLRVPVVPAQTVDPVGAGDAFAAGYLAGLLAGDSPEDRLELAGRCGAFAVGTHGDWEGLPTMAEVRRAGEGGDNVHR